MLALLSTPCAAAFVAPPIPAGVACGATASNAIEIRWTASAAAVDIWDINVAASAESAAQFPFLSLTVAGGGAVTSGAVIDLLPATSYWFKVRAHSAAAGRMQMMLGWSNFSRAVQCTSAPSPIAAVRNVRRAASASGVTWDVPRTGCVQTTVSHRVDAPSAHAPWFSDAGSWRSSTAVGAWAPLRGVRAGDDVWVRVDCDGALSDAVLLRNVVPRVDTTFIEPVRVAEQQLAVPDFLANHNSGTIRGDVGFLTAAGGTPAPAPPGVPTPAPTPSRFFNWEFSPRVRYCAEIANVDLSYLAQRGTSSFPDPGTGIVRSAAYADYASCNGARDSPDPTQLCVWATRDSAAAAAAAASGLPPARELAAALESPPFYGAPLFSHARAITHTALGTTTRACATTTSIASSRTRMRRSSRRCAPSTTRATAQAPRSPPALGGRARCRSRCRGRSSPSHRARR